MDKKTLIEIAGNANFLPGIYNWCDRWCERCVFTARCCNRALEKHSFPAGENLDIQNAMFWQKLGETLGTAMEMLKDYAEQNQIDITVKPEDIQQGLSKEYGSCYNMAVRYIETADRWFKRAGGDIAEKDRELNVREELGHRENDPFLESGRIRNAIEVINWYKPQIAVKLARAENDGSGQDKVLIDDSLSSAKIALIGIDRSLAAWETVRQFFPDQSEQVFDILLELDRLRKNIEQKYPDARAFKRPYFD